MVACQKGIPKKTTTAWEILKSNKHLCPSYIRQSYDIEIFHRSAVTMNFIALLNNDAYTGKSFEEIGKTIGAFRLASYLFLRSQYFGALQSYKKRNSLSSFIVSGVHLLRLL